jgi:hypothetical protein
MLITMKKFHSSPPQPLHLYSTLSDPSTKKPKISKRPTQTRRVSQYEYSKITPNEPLISPSGLFPFPSHSSIHPVVKK